jgi:hypothetical protein
VPKIQLCSLLNSRVPGWVGRFNIEKSLIYIKVGFAELLLKETAFYLKTFITCLGQKLIKLNVVSKRSVRFNNLC